MYYKNKKEVKEIHKKYKCSKDLKELMMKLAIKKLIAKDEHEMILKECGVKKSKIVDSSELDKYETNFDIHDYIDKENK